jgi:hypothetical protein
MLGNIPLSFFTRCLTGNNTSYIGNIVNEEAQYPADGHERCMPKRNIKQESLHAPTGRVR